MGSSTPVAEALEQLLPVAGRGVVVRDAAGEYLGCVPASRLGDAGPDATLGDLLLGLPQQVVLVSHDLDLAARCDRALLVQGGRVVADGPAAEVVQHYRDTA